MKNALIFSITYHALFDMAAPSLFISLNICLKLGFLILGWEFT